MYQKDISTDFAAEALKGAPPVAIAVTTATSAIDWQMWVLVLTAAYVSLQIMWLLWKFWTKAHGKYRGGDDG